MNNTDAMMQQTDYGMPVYNLQQMLRAVFQVNGMEPEVIMDGFFNETTENAVKNFQRMQNIEPTGVVDNRTWDLLVEAYDIALIEGKDPICVQLFTREDFKVGQGEARMRFAVLQAMLQVMHKRFENLPYVEITGIVDKQTNDALELYRAVFGLPKGMGMDNQLWYHFVKAYESSVLPHDFENPKNNGYKPEQARQQIDLSRRDENSMPDMLEDERRNAAMTENKTDTSLNRMPMLDRYPPIRSEMQTEPAQEVPKPMPKNRQTKQPLKWNF